MSLLDKIMKASRVKEVRVLSESETITNRSFTPTDVPALNIALSGHPLQGVYAGSTVIAGKSRHFKSKYLLRIMSCYLKARPNAVGIFYDAEFGSPKSYFEQEGIDPDRVVHCPVTSVEELRNEMFFQLNGDGKSNPGIQRGDEVFLAVDSLGGLASLKEIDDALEGKNVADMSRAKALKALFRIVRPHLILKDLPLVSVNHTYQEIGYLPKETMSGGTGALYNADDVWFVSRAQEKDGDELGGFRFTIRIEKSRLVREGSKFPISVSFEDGINRWSGLLDFAVELGVIQQKGAWYTLPDGQKLQKKTINEGGEAIWPPLLAGDFGKLLNQKFAYTPEEAQAKAAEAKEADATE